MKIERKSLKIYKKISFLYRRKIVKILMYKNAKEKIPEKSCKIYFLGQANFSYFAN